MSQIVDPEFIALQVEGISPLNIEQMRKDLAPILVPFDEETKDKISSYALVAAHAGIAAEKAHPGDEVVSAWNTGLLHVVIEALPLLQAENFGQILNEYFKFIQVQYPLAKAHKPGDEVAAALAVYYARKLVELNKKPKQQQNDSNNS